MSGLRLPRTVGISDQEGENVKRSWNTVDNAEDMISKFGLTPPDIPTFPRPTLTAEQLTTTINKDYTVLYSQHLAWFNYISPILARVKARLLQFKNSMLDIERTTRKRLREANKMLPKEEKLNERDIEDEIWADPDYKEYAKEEQRWTQVKLELESYMESMEYNLKVISRQVEIRKTELEGGRLENGMPSRGKFPPMRQQ